MNMKDGISKAATSLGLPLVDSNVEVFLIVDGKEYELEQFKIGFGKATDHKGEPQAETKGGQLVLTLSETLPETIYEWAIKPQKFKDGMVIFKIQMGNAPLKVEFFNTACISLNRTVSGGSGLQTSLILSPERMKVNGVEHNNYWKDE